MTKMLTHTIALLFVLAGCGAADTDGESLDPQQESVEDSVIPADGADQKDGDSPEARGAETAAEEDASDDDLTERPNAVFHAHVPRLPE